MSGHEINNNFSTLWHLAKGHKKVLLLTGLKIYGNVFRHFPGNIIRLQVIHQFDWYRLLYNC